MTGKCFVKQTLNKTVSGSKYSQGLMLRYTVATGTLSNFKTLHIPNTLRIRPPNRLARLNPYRISANQSPEPRRAAPLRRGRERAAHGSASAASFPANLAQSRVTAANRLYFSPVRVTLVGHRFWPCQSFELYN